MKIIIQQQQVYYKINIYYSTSSKKIQLNSNTNQTQTKMETQISFSTETIVQCLKVTYLSFTNSQISKATQILLRFYNQRPQAYIESLLSIIQSADYINNPSIDDLKKAASKQLKSVTFKFNWLQGSEEQTQSLFARLIPKMYQILTTNNLLTKGAKGYISESLASTIKSHEQIEKQVYQKLFFDLANVKQHYVLNSLKQLCSAFVQNRENPESMSDFLGNIFPLIKRIIVENFKNFIEAPEIDRQKNYLCIVEDFINFLDSTFVILVADDALYGQILHNIKQDKQFQAIYTQVLGFGFKQLGTIVTTQKITPCFNKVNKIKQFILESIQKIYVIDPLEIISMCVFTVMSCQSNFFPPEQNLQLSLIMKSLDLLSDNIEFNQNYLVFSTSFSFLLPKCLILCKLTPDDLSLIEQDPQKFVETTEDFCDKRQQYSIRMRTADLLKLFCKRIDGSLTYVKTICCDILRNVYFGRPMTYDITNSQINLSSDVIKKEVALSILALLYPLIKVTKDSLIEMKAFLLEMIVSFHQQTQLLIQLRIINLVGYVTDWNYLAIIADRMKQQPQVLKHQAFSTLNRMLRSNQILEGAGKFLAEVFVKEISTIQPNSKLFETIVIKNYSTLLSKYPDLKQKCIDRMVEAMLKIASTYSIEKDEQVPFHHFLSMVKLETNHQNIQIMENKFSVVLGRQSRRQSIESNVFEIMTEFLGILRKVSQNHHNFTVQLHKNFYQFYELRQFFLYMNSYIYFNTTNNLPFEILHEYLSISIMHKDTIMSPIVFIIGQMFYQHSDIIEMDNTVEAVLNYYEECSLEITKARLINIILQGIMRNPQRILKIIQQQRYLALTNEIINNTRLFSQPLDRKICILGLCTIIKMQAANNQSNLQILMAIVRMLESQYNKMKVKVNTPIYLNFEQFEKQNEMEEENNSSENAVQQVINRGTLSHQCSNNMADIASFDSDYYNKFLHPVCSIDEFLAFSELWQIIKSLYIPMLNPNQSQEVRRVLDIKKIQTGDKKTTTRRIVKIKQN